jgi:hypothetical protein
MTGMEQHNSMVQVNLQLFLSSGFVLSGLLPFLVVVLFLITRPHL